MKPDPDPKRIPGSTTLVTVTTYYIEKKNMYIKSVKISSAQKWLQSSLERFYGGNGHIRAAAVICTRVQQAPRTTDRVPHHR